MFLITRRTTIETAFTTPLDFCCNCGGKAPIELVPTSATQTRFWFIVATELTVTETYPYCQQCKASARRVRKGWMAKLLVSALMYALFSMALIFMASANKLPALMATNLFAISLILSLAVTLGYFHIREKQGANSSSYYQPVQLTAMNRKFDGTITSMTLLFSNRQYARVFAEANKALIRSGVLKVRSKPAR